MKELFGGTGNVKEKANVFGGGIKKSEGSTNIFAAFNAENPPIFGSGNIFGSTPTTNSIFSSSLHTTPASNETDKSATPFGGGLFGNKTNFSFNSGENGETPTKPFGAFLSTPTFGSSIFGAHSKPKIAPAVAPVGNIFGSGLTSTFSSAEAAKDLRETSSTFVPDFIQKSNDAGGFAALATSTAAPAGGFFGLTVKDDFFSKAAKGEVADTSQNDESANDENYDPHYDPIIALPEDEEKPKIGKISLFWMETRMSIRTVRCNCVLRKI